MAVAKKSKDGPVKVNPPDIRGILVKLKGTSPLVINRFSQKAKSDLEKPTSEKNKKVIRTRESIEREKKEAYNQARYKCGNWDGIQASAFRNAMISACKLTGIPMTRAKLSVFVEPDGFDDEEGKPLVKILGKPEFYADIGITAGMGRNPKPTYRPMYRKWGVQLKIKFDHDQIDEQSVVNLISRAGMQVGVGEGRHDSRQSNGQGFGCFEITR